MTATIETMAREFGRRLLAARESLNVSRADLAIGAECDPSTIERIEEGQCLPQFKTALRLVNAVRVHDVGAAMAMGHELLELFRDRDNPELDLNGDGVVNAMDLLAATARLEQVFGVLLCEAVRAATEEAIASGQMVTMSRAIADASDTLRVYRLTAERVRYRIN